MLQRLQSIFAPGFILVQDVINLPDFIKRKTLVFILLGSLIASFFPTCIICGQFAALSLQFESNPLN